MVFLDKLKVKLERLLVSGFFFHWNKIRRRISAVNYCPILYHVISFIQWNQTLFKWVTNNDILPIDLFCISDRIEYPFV